MFKALSVLFCVMSIFPIASSGAIEAINGAGATFPYPLYSKWFSEYNKQNPKIRINYQSVGSGAGIRQFISKTVDFGASDAPMLDEEIQKAGASVLHIPTVLGAVVLTYKLDASKPLKFSPEVIAGIYMGEIQKWNDPKLVALNPGVSLPATFITPIYRSDGSGTTAVFTDYLAKVSPNWKTKVGAGKAVKWPAGLGGKGNEGVTGMIQQTPGSIGYVEQVYALTNKMPVAQIQNAAGKFVEPSLESVTSAAENSIKNIPDDMRVSITNASGEKSYPISAFTYILVYENSKSEKSKHIKDFLIWSMNQGQSFAKNLAYAPLPKQLTQKVIQKIQKIQ